MDASRQGCDIIREFQQQQQGKAVQGTLKEGDNIKSVVTQADIDAQAKIVGGLRCTWGTDLNIIGEEDDDDDHDAMSATSKQINYEALGSGREAQYWTRK